MLQKKLFVNTASEKKIASQNFDVSGRRHLTTFDLNKHFKNVEPKHKLKNYRTEEFFKKLLNST